jgi:chromosome segregation ATPase
MANLDQLVEKLDEVRGYRKSLEETVRRNQEQIADLLNEERNLRRRIEREAHLF